MDNLTRLAAEALSECFHDILLKSDGFASFEKAAMRAGFESMAAAMSMALERHDDDLAKSRPLDATVHDRRRRTLLTECGQVTFTRRVYRDGHGRQFRLLDEELGIAERSRISPGAFGLVRDDALCASYGRAAEILCRHTRTSLSRTSVQAIVREAGRLALEQASKAADNLFSLGLAPAGGRKESVLCVEADGTWVALQGDDKAKAEVKAVTSYAGKGEGGRTNPVMSAWVGDPADAWMAAVARTGEVYDLSEIETVHLGSDGEAWCKAGARFFPNAEVVGHLDRWHLLKTIRWALDGPDAWSVWSACESGNAKSAADALAPRAENDDKVARLSSYIANNADIIGVPGPAMGTIECDNATVYKSRLGGRRAWSRKTLSAMACLLSLKASRMELPKQPAEQKRVWEVPVGMRPHQVVKSTGSGYEPPSGTLRRNDDSGKLFRDCIANGGLDLIPQ